MGTRRWKAVVAFVIAMGFLQIFYEDVMIFFGATGGGPQGLMDSPYVVIGIPLLISLSLIVVLIGGAILASDPLR